MTVKTTTTGGTIELTLGSKKIKINASEVTEITDALLAARKEAYGNLRVVREAAAEVKKAEKDAAKVAKLEARKAELEAKLAALAA